MYSHFGALYDHIILLRGILTYAANYTLEYNGINGKYRRKLLKKTPQICFKGKNQVLSIRLDFTCIREECICQVSNKDRKEMRLNGSSYSPCPYKRGVKFIDSYQFIAAPLSDMIADVNKHHMDRGKIKNRRWKCLVGRAQWRQGFASPQKT